MKFTAEDYMRASEERLLAAYHAHDAAQFAVSNYLSGVAIECLLRAFRWRVDRSWDEKHDVKELARKSGFWGHVPERRMEEFRAIVNDISVRWSISHRYAPASKLQSVLRRLDGYQGLSSRTLSDNSARMLDHADRLIKFGVLKWKGTLETNDE